MARRSQWAFPCTVHHSDGCAALVLQERKAAVESAEAALRRARTEARRAEEKRVEADAGRLEARHRATRTHATLTHRSAFRAPCTPLRRRWDCVVVGVLLQARRVRDELDDAAAAASAAWAVERDHLTKRAETAEAEAAARVSEASVATLALEHSRTMQSLWFEQREALLDEVGGAAPPGPQPQPRP